MNKNNLLHKKANDVRCLKNSKGITLVALIITIIIMLLLVGVSITIAIKGGLFDTTKRVAQETEEAKNKEQELANGRVKIDGIWYDSIEDYTKGEQSDYQPPEFGPYDEAKKDENGFLLENTTYTSEGKTAVIPKGFKIIDGLEGTKSIAKGLVIQDKDENEFVWIPVEVTASDKENKIASFFRSEWENNARGTSLTDSTQYIEPNQNGYEGEAQEYAEMVRSVYENKGFYIGRYEAGSKTERTNKENGTTEMVVKKNQYPYNYVGWGASMTDYINDVIDVKNRNQGKGAVYLSKSMYQNQDVGVTSTLCYGIQWDAILEFIKDDSHDVTNSSSWGNYSYAIYKTGCDHNDPNLSGDSYVAKNIYDIAGNLFELTMETFSDINCRVGRGSIQGSFSAIYTLEAAGRSNWNPFENINVFDKTGFRPALYIK